MNNRPCITRDVAAAAQSIRRGGLIGYPTEAVFGLGCDPSRPDSLARLLALKQRPSGKGLILIAASIPQLQPWCLPFPAIMQARIEPTWPGPVTWVVPARHDVSPLLTGKHGDSELTLAVRVSAHPLVIDLCNRLGHALVSTSANLSGRPPVCDADALAVQFGTQLDCILDGPLGELEQPTRIFDAASGRQLR